MCHTVSFLVKVEGRQTFKHGDELLKYIESDTHSNDNNLCYISSSQKCDTDGRSDFSFSERSEVDCGRGGTFFKILNR